MIRDRLRKRLTTGLVSLLSLVSCAPSSEIERTVEAVRNIENQPVPGVFIPNYPPYVPEEDPEPGNSKYPKQIIEYDDCDNIENLIDQKCNDNYTVLRANTGLNSAVLSGSILRYDHNIKNLPGYDLRLMLRPHDRYNYGGKKANFSICYVFPKTILFKGLEKEVTFTGWDKYSFFEIQHFPEDVVGESRHLTGDVFDIDIEKAIKDAGRETSYLAIINHHYEDLEVTCLIDLHGE